MTGERATGASNVPTRDTLAGGAAGLAIALGSLGVWLGDGTAQPAARALLVVGGAGAYLLLLVLSGYARSTEAGGGEVVQGGPLAAATALPAALLLANAAELRPLVAHAVAWVCIGLGIAIFGLLRQRIPRPTAGSAAPPRLAVALGAALLAEGALRAAWPGSLLLWGVAAVVLLFVPGLALGSALLGDRGPVERLLWAPPLSLGTLFLAVTWLDLVAIPASFATLFACSAVVTGAALLVATGGRRQP